MSSDLIKVGIWLHSQVKMVDLVLLELEGKTLHLTPLNLSKTMIARFFNVRFTSKGDS